MKIHYSLGIALMTALMCACGSTQDPAEMANSNPIKNISTLSQEEVDQLLPGGDSEIAKQFSEYAGIYKDDKGYHLLIKEASEGEIKSQTLGDIYKKISEYYPIYKNQTANQSSIGYSKVKYSYIDLANYKKIIMSSDLKYVNGVGFNPKDNVVTVSIRDVSGIEAAKREIIKIGVPEDAFKIITLKISSVAAATTLVRPAPAGVAVNPIVPGISAVCSMGPLVQNTTTKVVGFLIARHCVTSIGDNVTQGGQSIGQVHAMASISTSSTRDMAIISTAVGNIKPTSYAYMDDAKPNVSVSSYSTVEKYGISNLTSSIGDNVYSHGIWGKIYGSVALVGFTNEDGKDNKTSAKIKYNSLSCAIMSDANAAGIYAIMEGQSGAIVVQYNTASNTFDASGVTSAKADYQDGRYGFCYTPTNLLKGTFGNSWNIY